jgi:transcriptional regulator with XRE-family HTH domain
MNASPTLGRRIRHFRQRANLTLDALSDKVGLSGSQLSIIENGKREPKIGLVTSIAAALGVSVATLLETGAPDERSAKELELDELQHSALATRLGIPSTRVGKTMSDDTLDALLGLHREIVRRETTAIATPEEARRANTELRRAMRERILVIDGAMGTTIRTYGKTEADMRGKRFAGSRKDLLNNGDLFSLTQPEMICDIHRRFLEAGADIIETNTFSATTIGQSEFFVDDPREHGGRKDPAFYEKIVGDTVEQSTTINPIVHDDGLQVTEIVVARRINQR